MGARPAFARPLVPDSTVGAHAVRCAAQLATRFFSHTCFSIMPHVMLSACLCVLRLLHVQPRREALLGIFRRTYVLRESQFIAMGVPSSVIRGIFMARWSSQKRFFALATVSRQLRRPRGTTWLRAQQNDVASNCCFCAFFVHFVPRVRPQVGLAFGRVRHYHVGHVGLALWPTSL